MSELDDLRAKLAEAEDTLRAIREGEVDALLVADDSGERVYTLHSADAPYRALVEQMAEGAATLSLSGDIIYCNRRFANLFTVPLEQVVGISIYSLIDGATRTSLEPLLMEGEGQFYGTLPRGKQSLAVNVSVSRVTLDEIEYRTLIVSDISSLRRAERESQSKDEFLAMLAHELRNPLGAIQGAVSVLGALGLKEPAAIRVSGVIQRQVVHMARLVDDLLDVGRVVTGKITLTRRSIDLAENVRASVGAVLAARTSLESVELNLQPVCVNGDPVRLEQIVGNLLSNALKFSPPDQPVRIELTREDDEAVLRVTDRGAGISAELLPHIFDLFVQGTDTIARTKGGLGIGLTLVKRLVELHGGSVAASSEGEGLGSTFLVRLPVAEPVSAEPGTVAAPGTGRTVVLVDDNADSREMYRMMLQSQGHVVLEAGDGFEAMTVIRDADPDIAFIDIGLPGLNGYELAQKLRAESRPRPLALIALTGYGFPEDRERSRAAGFDGHLVKPVSPDELLRQLAALDETR